MYRCLCLLVLIVAGCDTPSTPVPSPSPSASVEAGLRRGNAPPREAAFDPQQCGNVKGVVRWTGPPPVIPLLESVENPVEYVPGSPHLKRAWPHPHTPRLNENRLAGALVWLEGALPTRSRNRDASVWLVALENRQFSQSRGLARVGDELAVVSRDPFFHSLQARGASHFSLALPEPGIVRKRPLQQPGIVELRSGAGMFWMRSYFLVQPHPFMAVTNQLGEFTFDEVPEGAYQLVAWHPSWEIIRRERSPDNLQVIQLQFSEGHRTQQPIRVTPRAASSAPVEVSLGGQP